MLFENTDLEDGEKSMPSRYKVESSVTLPDDRQRDMHLGPLKRTAQSGR